MQVGRDDLFHPHEEPRWSRRVLLGRLTRHSDGHEPRQGGGHLNAGKPFVAERITDPHGQVQAHVGDVGEGPAGVIGHRRQDGEDRPLEIRVGLSPLPIGQRRVVEDVDPVLGEQGQELTHDLPRALHQVGRLLANKRQLLGRSQPVHGALHHAGCHLLFEAGHTHHEELGEIRADDRQELHALEEGIPLVLGLFQHATEERQETQLPVEVLGRVPRHGGDRAACRWSDGVSQTPIPCRPVWSDSLPPRHLVSAGIPGDLREPQWAPSSG